MRTGAPGITAGLAMAAIIAACGVCASPAAAGSLGTDDSVFSGVRISLKRGEKPQALGRVVLTGAIPIPGPNQVVTVNLSREGRRVLSREVPTDPLSGRFHLRIKLTGCCSYIVQANHGSDYSDPYGFLVHGPRVLRPGRQILLFNQLLQKNGFHMGEVSEEFNDSTALAIHAMRKTNEMEVSEEYSPELFTMLLRGNGRFEPVHDEEGRHVEVDISRQVMALVEDGRATDVFHVSTGAGGTPRGDFAFQSKSPGYNAKGMYYSIFYDGNYATHGYSSVPDYPASHGCVRNPEVYSVFIYDWISIGDPMYIYD